MSSFHRRKVAACLLLLLKQEQRKKRKRRVWVRKWVAERTTHGFLNNLLEELRQEDATNIKNYVRMSEENFNELLGEVSPLIKKQDTHMRTSISPSAKLVITLRFLATGDSYHSLMHVFRVPVSTLSNMVPEVCEALYKVLKDEYLKPPDTDAWLAIADSFDKTWNFPNCLGALDGKHINVKAPSNDASTYLNHRKRHSIVLMALVDSICQFTFVDVSCPGRFADGGAFNQGKVGKALAQDPTSIHIPEDRPLPSGLVKVPFVVLADNAFTLQRHLLRPFADSARDAERIFDYRLSRAKRVSENAFGIASARFRVLQNTIDVYPQKAQKIVLCTMVLHNFLMKRSNVYVAPGDLDFETGEGDVVLGRWRTEPNFSNGNSMVPLRATHRPSEPRGTKVREIFKEYFMGDGKVSWQDKHISVEPVIAEDSVLFFPQN